MGAVFVFVNTGTVANEPWEVEAKWGYRRI